LDLLCSQLERRFDQHGVIHSAQIEDIFSAYRKRLASNDVRESLGIHESDFNIDDLVKELFRLPQLLSEKNVAPLVRDQITVTDIQKIMIMHDATFKKTFPNFVAYLL
jgi:hypothetical protein